MKLIDYIETQNIELNFPFRSKKHLFEQLAIKAGENAKETQEIYEALVQREKIGVTSLGNGVAIPHGKCLKNREVRVRIFVLNTPSNYESVDETLIQLVVCVIFPKETNEFHLELLRNIGTFFKKCRLYRAIINAQSANEIREIIFNEHT